MSQFTSCCSHKSSIFEGTRVRKRPVRATLLLIPLWHRRSLCRSVLDIYRGSLTYSRVRKCFRPLDTLLGTHCWAYIQCTGTNFQVANNDGRGTFRPLYTSTTSKRCARNDLRVVAQHVPGTSSSCYTAENPLNPEENCPPNRLLSCTAPTASPAA